MALDRMVQFRGHWLVEQKLVEREDIRVLHVVLLGRRGLGKVRSVYMVATIHTCLIGSCRESWLSS